MRYGKYTRIKGKQNQLFENSIINWNRMDQEMEKLIWEYIDGHISPVEQEKITRHIEQDSEWQLKYNELKAIHLLLQKEELEMPSLRFTKNVMEEIAQFQVAPATKNYINKNVIRGITAFFLIMIAGLFIYFIGQIHWVDNPTGSMLPAYYQDANNVNWGKLLNNTYVNIFIGINVILGLILIDKFLQAKKNAANDGQWSKGDNA
jgi:hypothetical protein